jgi:hypothetical protein
MWSPLLLVDVHNLLWRATRPPEVIVVFDGQYGASGPQQTDPSYKAQRPADDAALAPIRFLPGQASPQLPRPADIVETLGLW